MDNKQVKIIDCDLIRELRKSGRKAEAERLLKAFHKDKKKAGKQARYDYDRKMREVKTHLKICTILYCTRQAAKGKNLCEECLKLGRESKKRYEEKNPKRYLGRYKERKKKNICCICGKKDAAKDRVLCADCLKKARIKQQKYYQDKKKKNG